MNKRIRENTDTLFGPNADRFIESVASILSGELFDEVGEAAKIIGGEGATHDEIILIPKEEPERRQPPPVIIVIE